MKRVKIKKELLKYLVKISLLILIIIYIFFAPILVIKPLLLKQNLSNKKIEISYMGILELWNIDTFEGGGKSRTSFLEKQAISFEKEHKGTFIMVANMTLEQAKLNIENNKLPDIISFGIGAGEMLTPYLKTIDTNYQFKDNFLSAGKFNGKQLCVPYLYSGYSLISENNYQQSSTINEKLGFGLNGHNNPLLALNLSNMQFTNIYKKGKDIDTFTAYDRYLTKQFDCLVGTGRDLFRVNNRIENGSMNSRNFLSLTNFTDLIQYIGITSNDSQKKSISKMFVDYLLCDNVQKQIKSINMFSPICSEIYTSEDGAFYNLEQDLKQKTKTLNVFLSTEKLNEIKLLSYEILQGKKSASEVEKYLV